VRRLSKRDRAIIEHVFRYRISTREVIAQSFFEPHGLKLDAATSCLRRLAAPYQRGQNEKERRYSGRSFYLRSQLFSASGTVYYHLTTRGARVVASTAEFPHRALEKLDRPLNPQALAKHFSILSFCCFPGSQRKKITFHEVRTQLAPFAIPGVASDRYYFDLSETPPRLGFIRVDYARTKAETCVRKCYDDLLKRYTHDRFRKRILEGRFVVTLITPTEERRSQLVRTADDLPDPKLSRCIQCVVVPELHLVLPGGAPR